MHFQSRNGELPIFVTTIYGVYQSPFVDFFDACNPRLILLYSIVKALFI